MWCKIPFFNKNYTHMIIQGTKIINEMQTMKHVQKIGCASLIPLHNFFVHASTFHRYGLLHTDRQQNVIFLLQCSFFWEPLLPVWAKKRIATVCKKDVDLAQYGSANLRKHAILFESKLMLNNNTKTSKLLKLFQLCNTQNSIQ